MRRRVTGIAAVLLLVAGVALAADGGWRWWRAGRDRATIAALAAGRDVFVPPEADGPLQLARGVFLLRHGRPDEAQTIADRMGAGDDQQDRAALLYALGNTMLRKALADYLTKPIRLTAPLIRFAKAEYREVLHIDPQNWDARFNLDVASALVRDSEGRDPNVGQEMARERAFRPDIPGAPDGLP